MIYDINGNTLQDVGEPGIRGVNVALGIDINGDLVPDYTTSATTDATGNYAFSGLPPGTITYMRWLAGRSGSTLARRPAR